MHLQPLVLTSNVGLLSLQPLLMLCALSGRGQEYVATTSEDDVGQHCEVYRLMVMLADILLSRVVHCRKVLQEHCKIYQYRLAR